MIQRDIIPEARFMLSQFRSVCITGPRQSGKTTVGKMLFKGKPYVSFENPQTHAAAEADITAFMKKYSKGAILDEVQREPSVFRQLQGMLDKITKRGQFILTGSNNFLLQESISQSLAGRAGYIELFPLSYSELKKSNLASDDIAHHIFTGGYPEIWSENLVVTKWMQSYIQTYIQKDVRLVRNITNLATFTRFVYICAHYAGQIMNRDEIAKQIGIDTKTIQAWLGVLESSYIIYLLQPWHNNLNKRIIKSPKLYFIDTGLLCCLKSINNISSLKKNPQYGVIFENWIISEIKKNRANAGLHNGIYYFRDSTGNEVDLVTEKNGEIFGIEIKATKKPDRNSIRGLLYWKKNQPASNLHLFYGGKSSEQTNEGISILPWSEIHNF